jgi:phospholipid/cholesterol/gamma-HCH transport system substrate-binding protein
LNRAKTLVNLITFVGIAAVLLYFGLTQFLFPPEKGKTVTMTTANASGLLPRSDVTVRGVPSGSVSAVTLQDDGTALVTIGLDPGVVLTEGTTANITRRSPIGDITVDLTPGQGAPLESGANIPMDRVTTPPDPAETIRALSETLGALTPEDVRVVIEELATAVRGRGDDLATFSEAGAELPERILKVRTQLESLIRTGPEVLDVLADNAPVIADDIALTATLADILRDRRFDLVSLSDNTARFAQVLGTLIADEKPNLSCLLSDFALINQHVAQPRHLRDLISVLQLNHFFFGGAEQAVQGSKDGLNWFRVHFLLPQHPGEPFVPQRQRPDVQAGGACVSPFGVGVGPSSQPTGTYLSPGSELQPGRQA